MKFRLRLFGKILSMVLSACMVGMIAAPVAGAAEASEVVIKGLRATPNVRKDGRQEVEASLRNNGGAFSGYAKVTVGSERGYMVEIGNIAAGEQKVTVPVTDTHDMLEAGETTTLKIQLYDNDRGSGNPKAAYEDKAWARTRHWEVYLCQEMHTDLGYTAYQENLKDSFSGYLDTVKQYMENSDNRSTDLEKYKYAIESGFMLGESYMTRRTADDLQWIVDRIKEGRMEVGAGQFNYTVENFATEEAARATYFTNRHLVDMLGVQPSKTERMFDNPAFSKGYIDFAVQAGIKYGIHSMNPDRSPYNQKRQYDLFYMEGNDPANKMLIFNGKHYAANYGFGGDHFGSEGSVALAEKSVLELFRELEARSGRTAYPYDKFPMALVPFGDNQRPLEDQVIVANGLNKKWDDQGLAYPRIKTAFPDEFFEDVEAEYGDMIPVETGTEENWWNDGWGTTAYESGVNKQAGSLIPVAETAASFASLFTGKAYPYNTLYEAVERNLIYDEHTWGAAGYDDNSEQYHKQFEWKRSNAFGAKSLAGEVLGDSLDTLASAVPTAGKAVYVYNPLNWERDDVVTVEDLSGFPAHFLIKDGNASIPYTVEDGAEGNTIENDYYKVAFAADGTIASILDKKNGNRELVDGGSDAKFNQYQYYDDHGIPFANQGADFGADKWTLYTPEAEAGNLTVEENAVGATASLDTSTFRADSIVQKVTLYNDMPRIDIVNEVVKSPLPSVQDKEEAFYTFPFKTAGDYEIRYDMPAGNTAEGDQVYGTSTDWYTANKWVNVEDKADGYNMTLAIPNTSLLQFGERRTGNWSFDYKSEKPYIYSYVMNNMWQTNFQGDQPGYVSFQYAISTNKGDGMSDTARFGWEISNPLQATVIAGAQQGTAKAADSYLQVDSDKVQLTTMKAAEANGDGMIVRFHEITGNATGKVTVTLPFDVKSVTETDIIEDDKAQVAGAGKTFTFELGAYGVKTFRLRFGSAPGTVKDVKAVTTSKSTLENLSLSATAIASSFYDDGYRPENAFELANGQDWAAKNERVAWIEFTWDRMVEIGSFAIADRPNGNDNIQSAKMTFDDGTTLDITGIDGGGKPKLVTLNTPKQTRSAKVEVTGTDGTGNVGLSGLEFYAPGGQAANTEGTRVTWQPVDGALCYEVFRSPDPDFTAGSGSYIGSATDTQLYDAQVPGGLSRPYYYRVRAVAAGAKGEASAAVQQKEGVVNDTAPPSVPKLNAVVRMGTRVDLDWTPAADDVKVDHYEIYRDGGKIGETGDGYLCTYRDKTAQPNTSYSYTVKAVDTNGNASLSQAAAVTTFDTMGAALSDLTVSMGTLSPRFESGNRFYTLNLGDNFGRFDGVKVTATAVGENAKIYVNGVETAGGTESALAPLGKPGDKIVVKVVEGDLSKSYTLTAGTGDPILTAVDAAAGSQYDNQKPTLAIDGSGMTGTGLQAVHDNHSSAFTMWHTNGNPGDDAWIQVDLGKAYALDEMWIWNLNQANNTGRGLKNVKIQYTPDGVTWHDLAPEEGMAFTDSPEGYPFQFAQGTGKDGMAATNLNDGKKTPVRFGGAKARYIKITANPEPGVGSWGDVYYGLSELRFTSKLELRDLVPVSSITVAGENGVDAITTPGGSLQMTAAVQPADATKQAVDWSVADPDENVAVISEDGLLSAHRNGTVKVVATAKDGTGITGEAVVTISGQPEVISGVTAKAGDVYDEFNTPDKVVNGAGMSGRDSVYDTHDNHGNGITMWHTNAAPGTDAWIEFDLGKVQPVGEMWIWNMNQNNNSDRGLRDVKIEYRSAETDAWTALKGAGEGAYDHTFAKASGKPGQAATNLVGGKPVAFNLETRYVRITANPVNGEGNYGSEYYGLSEVRFTVGGTAETDPLRKALEAAQSAVEGLAVSNDTTADDILAAVQEAVGGTGVTAAWKRAFSLQPATFAEAGSLTGSLELSLDGQSLELTVDRVIPAIIIKGDLTKDGKVNVSDVMAACKVLARKSAGQNPTADELARGDMNGDTKLTITDVMGICKILADKA